MAPRSPSRRVRSAVQETATAPGASRPATRGPPEPPARAGCSRPPPPCSRASATPTPPPRRSRARPACRRPRSTSTSPTRRSASSRCSTPPRTTVLDAMRQAGRARDRRGPAGARAAIARRVPGDAGELSRRVADAAGRDHRRRPARLERRDRALEAVAVHRRAQRRTPARGSPAAASEHDAFAIVGAIVELASRQIRTGVPGDIRELEPVVERLTLGLLAAAEQP